MNIELKATGVKGGTEVIGIVGLSLYISDEGNFIYLGKKQMIELTETLLTYMVINKEQFLFKNQNKKIKIEREKSLEAIYKASKIMHRLFEK